MALNPFEQLEFLLPAPYRAFGAVVDALLRDRFGADVWRSDAAEGKTCVGNTQEVTAYQPKYFVGRWESRQRREIRNGLQQAIKELHQLRRWVLCTPTRTTPADLRWFNQWRALQPVPVELVDGNELSKWLRESGSRSALELLRRFGATVAGGEPAGVHGKLRIRPAGPQAGLTHYLYVSVCHGGGSSAVRSLRVELAHSPTGCVSLHHDENQWADETKGCVNPRMLRAHKPLLPDEDRLVAVIPVGFRTPLPLTVCLKASSAETASTEQHICLEASALGLIEHADFVNGPAPGLVPVGLMPAHAGAE
ncbi:MAG TPA: hypothetical protein VGD78_04930 [Chthoniobacterales bacterium]